MAKQVMPDEDLTVPPVERRMVTDLRVPVGASVTLHAATFLVQGSVPNVSRGGGFVATSSLLPVDSKVWLEIELPTGKVDLAGTVVWVRTVATPGAPTGFGVQFLQLDPAVIARLDAFLRQGQTPG